MQIIPLNRIDCMLLHDTADGLPESDLKACVTGVLTAAGLTPVEEPAESAGQGRTLVFRAGSWRLRVHAVPAPLAPQTLQNALALPYTRTIFAGAEQVVQAHAGHTWLSLEKTADDAPAQTLPFTRSEEVMPAMSLVALLAREIMARQPASAIYWAPSDHLLPPPLFETLTSDTRLILLNIRPQYVTGQSPAGQAQPVGMIAWGTQHIVGRLIVIEPAALAPGDLHSLAAGIVATLLERGRLPAPGERLPAAGTGWAAVMQPDASAKVAGLPALHFQAVPSAAASDAAARTPRQERRPAFATAATSATASSTTASATAATSPAKATPGLEDRELSSLPPELREGILEQRRRRVHVDSLSEVGALKTTAMNFAIGAVVLVIVANIFFGRLGLSQPPAAEKPPARVVKTRIDDEPRRPRIVPGTAYRPGLDEDERAVRRELAREGREAARDERIEDEEREAARDDYLDDNDRRPRSEGRVPEEPRAGGSQDLDSEISRLDEIDERQDYLND